MSRLAGRMPGGLGQARATWTALSASATRRPVCLALRAGAGTGTAPVPVRFSSSEPQGPQGPRSTGPSFKGQLTHSIMNRLQREKADLERMARTRPESSWAKNLSLSFGARSLRLPVYPPWF